MVCSMWYEIFEMAASIVPEAQREFDQYYKAK
jgi:hypothetical protein